MNTSSNVISLHEDYASLMIKVSSDVRLKLAQGVDVDPTEIINNFIDPAKNNSELERVFSDEGLMSKGEFKKAVKRKKRNEEIRTALGYLPTNVGSYVAGYVKKHNVRVMLNGELKRNVIVELNGQVITEEDRKDRQIDTHYRIRASEPFNTEDMKLELRTTRDQYGLDYSDSQIADAVQAFYKESKKNRRVELFENIAFQKGVATGPEGEAMWQKMEKAAFDVTRTQPGFATAVIKKFMWQVKRKGLGLTITNHLMPVLTGKQGGGKSTLVNAMLEPLNDGVKQATFNDIADNRLIDLWETPVLFMDEMSGAKKADMTTVKQAITASVLTRRPMRSNTDIQVQQKATFIGCSNEGLGEIIRDTTGIRRFAELEFTNNPDWDAMNEIDWLMLWHSVDEMASDPSLHIVDTLKEQQEVNRNMCPVEAWAREHKDTNRNWTKSSQLHAAFQEWEKQAFPGYNTNMVNFGKRMNSLIRQHTDFGWQVQSKSGYTWFKAM